MLDRAVLAGGVHGLEDQQQRPAILGVELVLQLGQQLDARPQELPGFRCRSVDVRYPGPGSDEENEAIWLARRSVFGALARLSPTTFSEDTTVPVSELPTMLRKFPQIAEKYKVRIAVVAHAGDGNIHPCLSFDERDQEEKARVELAAREIVAESLALGGTLSGEHGIGISKARFLPMEFDPATLQIMREIKRSFDPLGILSPNSFVGQKLKG